MSTQKIKSDRNKIIYIIKNNYGYISIFDQNLYICIEFDIKWRIIRSGSLDTLRAHIQELMRRCNVLKREKEELEKRIEEQKSTIATLQRDLDEMSIKYQDLLTARGLALGESDIKAARNRFGKLVREIDKCISLLNE